MVRTPRLAGYTDPEDATSIEERQYTAYRRRHGGSWVLHDDMHVKEEVPILDDLADDNGVP